MTSTPELTTVKNTRPPPDQALVDIADYVCNYKIQNEQSLETARLCMTDALACALDALDFEEYCRWPITLVASALRRAKNRCKCATSSSILSRPTK